MHLLGPGLKLPLTLLVNDVNDNPPIFGQPTYNTTYQKALIGHLFYKLCLLIQTREQ